jgi:hypothetical protein
MSTQIRIKNAQIFYQENLRFNRFFDQITGYGVTDFNLNDIVIGQIQDPTGFQPAIFYKTGILNGVVPEGAGSFTWSDIFLNGFGESGKVFLNYITGYRQSSTEINFKFVSPSFLTEGDVIGINGVAFTYNPEPSSLFEFNTYERLANILTSGAFGFYNSQDNGILQNIVGVTGFYQPNPPKIVLYSYLRSGEDGNNNYVYKDIADLSLINIANRYFTGGQTLRPSTDKWTGVFFNTFNITKENSGVYFTNFDNIPTFANISGVVWDDNFSGNYYILTGLKDPRDPLSFTSGRQAYIPYNINIDKYSGFAVIPSGQSSAYTGLNIEILKPNPYNISGNISKYIVSGNDFLFTGLIRG